MYSTAGYQSVEINKGIIMGKNVKKRKRRRFLQKRARRTIASLLLVSALIVSVIPTQKKTQAYVDPETDKVVKTLDDVIGHDDVIGYNMYEINDTKVKADNEDKIYYAFPYSEQVQKTGKKIGDDGSITEDAEGSVYFKIDESAMDSKAEIPVIPVFKMGTITDDEGSEESTLEKFYGYKGDFSGAVNLSNGVCYNKGTENKKYVVEEDGRYFQYTQTYIPGTVQPGNLDRKCYKVEVQEVDTISANEIPKPVGDPMKTFYACDTFTHVHNISDEAFKGDSQLKSIDISSDQLRKIGNSAFEDCAFLSQVNFGDKLSSIGRKAFCGCKSLAGDNAINFSRGDGKSLRIIGDGAFAYCENLAGFELPPITDLGIGAGAFYGCNAFTGMNEDANKKLFGQYTSGDVRIGPYAFADCPSLVNVSMYTNLKPYMKGGHYEGELYSDRMPKNPDLDDPCGYDFQGLFAGCINLTKVALPASYGSDAIFNMDKFDEVDKLGRYMFQNCGVLERVKFTGSNAAPYNDYQFVTVSSLPYASQDKNRPAGAPKVNKENVPEKFVIEGPDPDVTESAAHNKHNSYGFI